MRRRRRSGSWGGQADFYRVYATAFLARITRLSTSTRSFTNAFSPGEDWTRRVIGFRDMVSCHRQNRNPLGEKS